MVLTFIGVITVGWGASIAAGDSGGGSSSSSSSSNADSSQQLIGTALVVGAQLFTALQVHASMCIFVCGLSALTSLEDPLVGRVPFTCYAPVNTRTHARMCAHEHVCI